MSNLALHSHPVTLSDEDWSAEDETAAESSEWVMKKLKPKHLDICSLLAQGFQNVQIAKMVSCTPQYITMLLRQPLIKTQIAKMCEVAGVRMEALTVQSTEVIADVMANGKHGDRLKAARIQMEATGRIGTKNARLPDAGGADERLERLAGRLIDLLDTNRRVANGNVETYFPEAGSQLRILSGCDNSAEGDGIIEGESRQISRESEGTSAGT